MPIVKLKLLFTIEREFLFKGEYYPLMNETADVINVRIPMSVIEREGIEEYNDPRDPIISFRKTGNETIREIKTILHPARDTQVRIIVPASGNTNGRADDRANGQADDLSNNQPGDQMNECSNGRES